MLLSIAPQSEGMYSESTEPRRWYNLIPSTHYSEKADQESSLTWIASEANCVWETHMQKESSRQSRKIVIKAVISIKPRIKIMISHCLVMVSSFLIEFVLPVLMNIVLLLFLCHKISERTDSKWFCQIHNFSTPQSFTWHPYFRYWIYYY